MCGSNNKQPCAWGAAKVMLAFSKLPREEWTPQIEKAVDQGVDFLFSVDPATAAYPSGWNDKPSRNWWKFGFPVFYVTDILQISEALVGLYNTDRPHLSLGMATPQDAYHGLVIDVPVIDIPAAVLGSPIT
jgi:hypothetical protein